MPSLHRRHLLLGPCTALLALLAALALAPSARASGSCPDRPLSQPFLPFLDANQYMAVGDAGLEQGGEDWALSGGAHVVDDQEPWLVGGPGAQALDLPAGSSALTPPVCVSLEDPTARFFVRSGDPLGSLSVSVVLTDDDGAVQELPSVPVVPVETWAPSLPIPVLVNLVAPLSGDHVHVQLHFSTLLGDVRVDDVYVDPYKVT